MIFSSPRKTKGFSLWWYKGWWSAIQAQSGSAEICATDKQQIPLLELKSRGATCRGGAVLGCGISMCKGIFFHELVIGISPICHGLVMVAEQNGMCKECCNLLTHFYFHILYVYNIWKYKYFTLYSAVKAIQRWKSERIKIMMKYQRFW